MVIVMVIVMVVSDGYNDGYSHGDITTNEKWGEIISE